MDFILLLKKILLAIIQGITEILPISSSGHLLIFENILQMDANGLTFIIFLHFGSLVAMIAYYWKDIWGILKGLWCFLFKHDRSEETKYFCRLFINLVIASIPAGLVGIFLNDYIETYLTSLYFVFSFLIVTGVLLLTTRFLQGEKTLKDMKPWDALAIGCFQGVGVLPGISRSGSTIFGGRVMRLSNEEAAHFSFLMFLPVTAGSFLIDVIKERELIFSQTWDIILGDVIAIIIAGFVTYFAVKYLLKIIKKGKLWYFSIYCFAVGISGIIVCLCCHYGF